MRFSLLVVLGVMLCGCGPSREQVSADAAKAEKSKAAVQLVVMEAKDAMTQAASPRKAGYSKGGKVMFDEKKLLALLHNIGTTDCPENFRLAFLDYVQTWERKNTTLRGLNGSSEVALSYAKPNGIVLKDGLDRIASVDTEESWRKVEMAAMQCGVGR